MNDISFTSRIRHCTKNEFNMVANRIGVKNYVGYPWTIKESVCSDSAYTRSIADCIVCGITDGLKVLLIHLCPTNAENFDFFNGNPSLSGMILRVGVDNLNTCFSRNQNTDMGKAFVFLIKISDFF